MMTLFSLTPKIAVHNFTFSHMLRRPGWLCFLYSTHATPSATDKFTVYCPLWRALTDTEIGKTLSQLRSVTVSSWRFFVPIPICGGSNDSCKFTTLQLIHTISFALSCKTLPNPDSRKLSLSLLRISPTDQLHLRIFARIRILLGNIRCLFVHA